MSTTVVESLPLYFFKLTPDANKMSGCAYNSKGLKGAGCSSVPVDPGFAGCGSRAVAPASFQPPVSSPSQCASKPIEANYAPKPTCDAVGHGSRAQIVSRQDRIVTFLKKIREPIADYLEKHGLPKNAPCSFVTLVTSLVQRAYNAGVTICMMLMNLFPLLDGFVYLARFVLDKTIEICETKDRTEVVLKSGLFVGELFILFILVAAIFGMILMPVWSLVGYVANKCIGVVTSVH